jgi:hypothetical protein
MTFFVTSAGPGNGGNLGGLRRRRRALPEAGRGRRRGRPHVARLPQHAGAGAHDTNFVNARDRIGAGRGATSRATSSRGTWPISIRRAATSTRRRRRREGHLVNGRTEQPNNHDMLTGSRPDGTAFAGAPFSDMTCGNWTKGGADGSAMLGHHDVAGPVDNAWAKSWNSSHPSRGCDTPHVAQHGRRGPVLLLRDELTPRPQAARQRRAGRRHSTSGVARCDDTKMVASLTAKTSCSSPGVV